VRTRLICLGVLLFAICLGAFGIDPPTGLRISTSSSPVSDNPASSSPVSSSAGISRNSGVAPLSVHFTADLTASSSSSRAFHNYDYTWNFGDSGAGTWGTTGKSKNVAKGAVATHVYETPGSYTATLIVRNRSGVAASKTFQITVDNPDTVYSGTKTICVCDTASNSFAGSPPGALLVATDDLSTITQYAIAGRRILFHRGSAWSTGGLTFPNSAGPVTLGAYGSGVSADKLGIYSNAPRITVTSGTFCDLSDKQDWRIMDLQLVDATRSYGSFGGASNMQRILFLRVRVDGFSVGIGWSHYNSGTPPRTIDQMVVAECEMANGNLHSLYVGGERLALLGNIAKDARTSHVIRVWQAFMGVIQHNEISGSSLDTADGRHALKLHGPGGNEYGTPADGNTRLANETAFSIISDNVFGGSGPWPVAIGPQDGGANEALWDIIFERNRIATAYGSQSSTPVQVALHVWGRYITVRNNIFDGTNSSNDYTAMIIARRGVEPPPVGVEIYNNTIYRQDNTVGNERIGIIVSNASSGTIVKNNLVSFPGATVPTVMINNSSVDLVSSNNLKTDTPRFNDPDNSNPLARNFGLLSSSPAVNQGTSVPVFDDFAGGTRPIGLFDVGALERQ
jgi:hypothetical protein